MGKIIAREGCGGVAGEANTCAQGVQGGKQRKQRMAEGGVSWPAGEEGVLIWRAASLTCADGMMVNLNEH
jgi:hypothetical protein